MRSQMDLRICFRVREPRDVDLILGQGMLRAGWDAHNLNAPGKFLVSAPGHDRPKRARAYLLTDEVVAIPPRIIPGFARSWMRNPGVRSITRAGLARNRQTARLRQAIRRKRQRRGKQRTARSGWRYAQPRPKGGNQRTHAHYRMEAHEALPALARVRRSGTRYPGQPGTVARSDHRRAVTVSDRPAGRLVPPPRARVCTSRANTDNGTNDGTNTERAGRHSPAGTVTEGR